MKDTRYEIYEIPEIRDTRDTRYERYKIREIQDTRDTRDNKFCDWIMITRMRRITSLVTVVTGVSCGHNARNTLVGNA